MVDTDKTRTKKISTEKATSNMVAWLDKLNFKEHASNHKLARLWNYRNCDHGTVFANSLEIDYIIFQQNLFIENTKEISDKLTRIGFVVQEDYPNKHYYESFSTVMYHPAHNIAVSLYHPKHKEAIQVASKIVKTANISNETALAVFVATMVVLI